MATEETLYDSLGVPSTATMSEIDKAFRREATRLSPAKSIDNRSEAEAKLRELAAIHKLLSDPLQRAAYDVWRASQTSGAVSADRSPAAHTGAPPDWEQNPSAGNDSSADRVPAWKSPAPGPEERASAPQSVLVATAESSGNGAARDAPEEGAGGAALKQIALMSWAEARPYYVAAIGGIHVDEVIGERANKPPRSRMLLRSVVSGLSLIGVVLGMDKLLGSSIALGIVVIVLAVVVNFTLGAGVTAERERSRRSMHKYLAVFQAFHNSCALPKKALAFNFSAFVGSGLWLAYRRMPFLALIVLALTAVVVVVTEIAVRVFSSSINLPVVGMGMAILFGFVANKLYFWNIRRRIHQLAGLPSATALTTLRGTGGTNNWSLLVYLVLIISALIPVSYLSERAVRELVIRELENSYPALNQMSPEFDQLAVDEALTRLQDKLTRGLPFEKALRQSVSEMEREGLLSGNN